MGIRPGARSVRRCLEIVVTLSTVTACAPAPDRAQHSVDYYQSHAELRQRVLARCANDSGRAGSSADCVNAGAAARIDGVGSLKALPPMGLPANPAGRAGR
jgi:hypothetical protein